MDAIVILGIALLAYIAGTICDFASILFQFGIDHADWEADNILFAILVVGVAMTVCGLRRYVDLAREIKARVLAEQEASSLARHDSLTGLPNRRLFEEKLKEYLDGSATNRIAVLMLDLDGFKAVNDTYGYAVGDKALSQFADRVSSVLRAGTLFARIGGDEFAIIKPKIESLDDPTNLARRIAAAVAEPFLIENVATEFGVGIGIAIAPDDGVNSAELVRRADRALYRAKATGRSTVRFFEPDMDAHVERRIQLERELRSAVAADILEPRYQPLVSLEDNGIIGFEALARWNHNDFGNIPPTCLFRWQKKLALSTRSETSFFAARVSMPRCGRNLHSCGQCFASSIPRSDTWIEDPIDSWTDRIQSAAPGGRDH
jgi:diguanylate cyclase (GGDEF)-like protein